MFGTGLFGGAGHCIGMCGPLVATYTISIGLSPLEKIKPHLIYHSGRLMSYGIIGGFMGLTGSFISTVKGIQHIQSIAMVLAGVVMILMGLSVIGLRLRTEDRRQRTEDRQTEQKLGRLEARKLRSFLKENFFHNLTSALLLFRASALMSGSLFPLGLINGVIPCGLSYTAFIGAAGLGASQSEPLVGFLKGMFLLLIFGAGTIPALLLIAMLASKFTGILRKRLYKIAGLFMIVSGLIFIYRALRSL